MEFTVLTDRHLVGSGGHSRRYVLVKLTAPRNRGGKTATRPPVNVAFVLDRSGSMAGSKLALAKYAVERALQGLLPTDHFSVVTYDDKVETVVGSRPATTANKEKARIRLQDVDARGTTDLHGGWTRGADEIRKHPADDAINRCLLLTDGLANVGVVDPGLLTACATDLRASGVATSTFGVGADFDESLLQSLADAGLGHFYYIEAPEQIPDLMTSELGELLETVAREVVVDIKHAPELELRPLSPVVAAAAVPGETRLLVGDLVVGQSVELVIEARFPDMPVGASTTAFLTVADRDGVLKADGCSLSWEHVDDAANQAQERNREVDRAVARLYAAKARQQAVALNRVGNYQDAEQALRSVAARINGYAGSDTELHDLVAGLRADEKNVAVLMSEADRKATHYGASVAMRSRAPDGRARRKT